MDPDPTPARDGALRERELIVSGRLDRAIVHLGAPAALAALLQAGFLVVDTFWLGRVGAVAIAAASTGGFVMWLAQTLGEGTANGAGAVLARAVGAGDAAGARRAAGAGLTLVVWASLAILALGLPLRHEVFRFMGTAPEVSEAGAQYLGIILLGMPAFFAFAWIAAAFRATGDARTPLRLLGVAALTNLVADPILIFGLGPLPALGVRGAALATVGAWLAGAVAGWHLLAERGLRPPILAFLKPPRETAAALRIGLPLAAEGAVFSLIYVLLTRITTTFGTAPVAALGVGHKLEVLNYFVCAGMGSAAITLVGQSLGAGDHQRAMRAAWRTLFLTCLPVGALTTLLVAVPHRAVAVFISDPAVVAAGSTYVIIVGLSQIFMAAEVVLIGAFAGAHRTTGPAMITVALTAARIPLATALAGLGWGVEAVWTAIAVSTVLKGMVLAILWARWSRRSSPPAVPESTGQTLGAPLT